MARILINNIWYDEISTQGMYESQFEDIVRSQAEILFPEYITIPFKITVESNEGTAKADLALIDRDYLGWWVVEVEMGRHSLPRHVLPQVKILSEGRYDERVARYFFEKQPVLNERKLLEMMKGMQPRVVVIVDLPRSEWIAKLEKHNALLALFQMFKSAGDHYIYRVNGHYPDVFDKGRSKCYFEKLIANFLIVESPAILDVRNNDKIEILFGNGLTEWRRLDIADKIYLIPTGYNPLKINEKYLLFKKVSGEFLLQQI